MALIDPDATALRLAELCEHYLRAADTYQTDGSTGAPVLVFVPPLTAAEQAKYDDLALMARFGISSSLTLAEFQAIKPALADARTQRQRTDAQWSALTAAQRDTQLIAWCRDLTDVLRALLRS